MDILANHNFNDVSVTMVADSMSPKGHRLSSMVVTFPRYMLAELNTHRALSRNSASSRAIPFNRMVQLVKEQPFVPKKWQKDNSGMQGFEYFSPEEALELRLLEDHLNARDNAVTLAVVQSSKGLTKQICNRYLEPFMWHTALISATEWENMLAQRAEAGADIHFQELAYKILEVLNTSNTRLLDAGEWHIPFGDSIDYLDPVFNYLSKEGIELAARKIAVARCARLSYLNFDGSKDYALDIKLHDKLASMAHYSPFEHVAKTMTNSDHFYSKVTGVDSTGEYKVKKGVCGNFTGFIQYRKMLPYENRKDSRLINKFVA